MDCHQSSHLIFRYNLYVHFYFRHFNFQLFKPVPVFLILYETVGTFQISIYEILICFPWRETIV